MKEININAPVNCRKTININAPKEIIWELLTDIDNWATWNSSISKARLNGNLEANATFNWKSEGVNIHSTIHTVESNRFLGWTGKALGTYAIHNWSLNETNGQTIVSVEESMEGFLVNLFRKTFSKNLEKGMEKWLNSLKQECEKRSPNR